MRRRHARRSVSVFPRVVHHERRVRCHVERGRKPDWRVDLLWDRFGRRFVLEALFVRVESQQQTLSNERAYLELKTEHGRQLAYAQTLDRFVCLGAFTAAVLFHAELLGLGEPSIPNMVSAFLEMRK